MKSRTKLRSAVLSVAATGTLLISAVSPAINYQTADAATASYVTLDKFSGKPATTLLISGGNYYSGELVAITVVENGTLIASTSAQASAYGEFATSVTLPVKLSQGNAVVTATGKTSGNIATNNYYVSPFTPTVTTSAGASDPFSELKVSATGFAPNEGVTINFAGTVVKTKADVNGAFNDVKVSTPSVPAASYTLVAEGDASGASAVAYQYINSFYASASPNSYYVLPATELAFNGSGFAANETIAVTESKSGSVLTTFTADAFGGFKNGGSFVVPSEYAGLTMTFVLTGSISHAVASTGVTVGKYFPSVSPSVYYTMPGTTVNFNGAGFAAGEAIDITNGTTTVGTAFADSKGIIKNAGNVKVPLTASGTDQTYILTGRTSHGMGTATIQIGGYSPQVSPSSYYALPGSTVTFTGSGYAPGETVTVTDTKKNVVATFVVGDDGTFTATGGVMVGYAQAGSSVSLTLQGSVSKQALNIGFGVGELSTQLSPSSYYVLPFEVFSVKASGFAPNETIVLTNGTTVLATAKANDLGVAMLDNVSLPAGSANAQLVAKGQTSNATSTVNVGVGSYSASVSASDYYVRPGTEIQLMGGGFAPNEEVTIKAATTSLKVTADSKGTVSTLFVVPFGSSKNVLDVTTAGTKSGASATTTITLAPFTPDVAPSTYYATPGSNVSFTGSGYVPGETVSIFLDTTVIGTEKVDAKGKLASKQYVLPFGTTADYTLTSDMSATTTKVLVGLAQFYAGTQLDSYYGKGGSTVTVQGSGYAAGETVSINASNSLISTAAADSNGAFSKAVTIPYAVPGSLLISSTGNSSKAVSSTTYTVAVVYTSVQLAAYAPAAGEAVTFIGDGYLPNEPIVISSDRISGSYTLKALPNGTFSDSGYVLAKSLAPGEMTLTITGTYSHTVSTITIYVTPAK